MSVKRYSATYPRMSIFRPLENIKPVASDQGARDQSVGKIRSLPGSTLCNSKQLDNRVTCPVFLMAVNCDNVVRTTTLRMFQTECTAPALFWRFTFSCGVRDSAATLSHEMLVAELIQRAFLCIMSSSLYRSSSALPDWSSPLTSERHSMFVFDFKRCFCHVI